MPVNPNTIFQQLGSILSVAAKIRARGRHALLGGDQLANSDSDLLRQGFSLADTQEKDVLNRFLAYLADTEGPAMRLRFAAFREVFRDQAAGFGRLLAEDLDAEADERARGMIGYDRDLALTDGNVVLAQRRGLLGLLHRWMEDNKYKIIANAVTFGALTEIDTNKGDLEVTKLKGESHLFAGTLTIRCTRDDVTAPEFSVQWEPDEPLPDGLSAIVGEHLAVAERDWFDGRIGVIDAKFTRPGLASPTETGDVNAVFSAVSFEHPKTSDCDKGKFFPYFKRLPDDKWQIEFYRDSARTFKVGALVLSGTSGTQAVSKLLTGGTRVNFTFHLGNAHANYPSVGDDEDGIEFDIRTPRIGDRWTIAVTNAATANFATKLGQLERATLPSGPAKPASAPSAALAGDGAGNVDNGTHSYKVAFFSATLGESGGSAPSNTVTVVDKNVNGKVNLTAIPTGPAGTTKRRLYRTKAGEAATGPWYFLADVNDNVTTTYQDDIADASLGGKVWNEVNDSLAATITQ